MHLLWVATRNTVTAVIFTFVIAVILSLRVSDRRVIDWFHIYVLDPRDIDQVAETVTRYYDDVRSNLPEIVFRYKSKK